jgi:murein DD-endopeptidase MepM/ murein hydrolase activator NlpD
VFILTSMSRVVRVVVLGSLALVAASLVTMGVIVKIRHGDRLSAEPWAAQSHMVVPTTPAPAAGAPISTAPAPQGEEPASESRESPAHVAGDASPADAPRTTTVALRRGENLVAALARHGIDSGVGHVVATALRGRGANLRKLKPRDTIAVTWERRDPVRIAYAASPWVGFAAVARGEGGWAVERTETQPDVRTAVVSGEVKTSLFQAVDDAGESPQLLIDLVDVFSSDFDFTADTRAGDHFRLIVEKRYAGKTFVDYGRILGAQYVSDARVLTGVAFESRAGARPMWYDLEGRSLKKSFLKSPLEFTRITSGFTYARPHPILGGTRPHLAIDYGAPVGTPVRAVADGVVVSAGWAGGNGIQVKLRHRSGYETMYNHLSRASVKAGGRVKQRQVIGLVGSTGLSTGPHLDYRVSKNGIFVNPLGEKFLPGEPIAARDRARFDAHARTLVTRMESEAAF